MLDLAYKHIVILGLGREGLSTYRFLRQQLPDQTFILADQQALAKILADFPDWQTIKDQDQNLVWQLGDDYLRGLTEADLVVKTAGIPITLPEIQAALETNPTLRISSNMQLFFERCPGTIIGITGSKGKSTTSQLTFDLLNQAGKPSVLLGNIGRPALSQLAVIDQDTLVVAELSSHQLAELKASPQVAVVLNITPEHLDYFVDFEAYFQSKTAIVRYQNPNDYLIYDPQLAGAKRLAELSAVRTNHRWQYDLEKQPAYRIFVDQGKIYYRAPESSDTTSSTAELIMEAEQIPLLGKHNLYNVLAAISVAKLFQVSNQQIVQTIKNFQGLAHRLQFIAELNGVSYYDDSIATNPIAGAAAIASFPKARVILLAGGHDKKLDFAEYIQAIIKQQVKAILLFPPTGTSLLEQLQQAWREQKLDPKTFPKTKLVKSMAEAVDQAKTWAETDDIVLLSPACASFGLFKNYQDRGQQFQLAVGK